jgi:predicted NACHT family NTPase
MLSADAVIPEAGASFFAAHSSAIIAAIAAILVAVIGAGVTLFQIRKNRALEREKVGWQDKLEQQRIELENRFEKERMEQAWRHEEERRAEEQERDTQRSAQLHAARESGLQNYAESYCDKLAQELSALKILDMSRPLDLQNLYVQVRVKEQESSKFAKENEPANHELHNTRTFIEPRGLAAGPGATSSYSPIDALQRYQRIVVIGDPGAGKTTMLRHLALRMIKPSVTGLPWLPVYVSLTEFAASPFTSLLDFAAAQWRDKYGFPDASDFIVSKLDGNAAALLLDGLDEVLGGESAEEAAALYSKVSHEISRLATRFPGVPIAVTCRRHGWRGGLTSFQVLEALDFEWPQIKTFIDNWFGIHTGRAEGLAQALETSSRLQTLAANPLLLSLIAIVYERDLELPERRAALYRRCIEVLLREWDAHRQIKRFSRFTTDRKQDLLKRIAEHYHMRGQRYFAENDLLELIAKFLPTINISESESRAILDEIAAQYGLLKVQSEGYYGFLHLTIQENFTAVALLEQGQPGLDIVLDRRYDEWWEEVILLYAGSMPDATPLLHGVLQLSVGKKSADYEQKYLISHDDLFHTDLLLAGRCLTTAPIVSAVALRHAITGAVRTLFESGQFALDRQQAAGVLVELTRSGPEFEDLFRYIADNSKPVGSRIELIDALAVSGGPEVANRLIGVWELNPQLDGTVRERIVEAIGTLRAYHALNLLRAQLEAKIPDGYRCALIRSIGQLGAPVE